MNKVIISSVVSDLLGHIEIPLKLNKSEVYSMKRRVSKKATLDGGSVVEDFGFTHTDRLFKIVATLSKAQITALNYLIENFSSVVLSSVDGLYLAAIQDSRVKGTEVTLKLIIKEKLTS